jgi:hypothetical protein
LPQARQATTRPRVILAVIFSLVFPGLALGVGFGGMAGVVLGPVLGLALGWPFVCAACGVWSILHAMRRHHVTAAVAVGVATSLTVWRLLTAGQVDIPVLAGFTALGAASGLGVWWIVYGRQNRLPKPIVTRPPLAL